MSSFLLDSLVRSTAIGSVVLLAAFAFAAFSRRSAALRHLGWTIAFGLLLVLPGVSLLSIPRLTIPIRVLAPAPLPSPHPSIPLAPNSVTSVPVSEPAPVPMSLPDVSVPWTPEIRPTRAAPVSIPTVILAVWACGVLAVGLWAVSAALGILAVCRRSTAVEAEKFGIRRYASQIGIERHLSVREGAEGAPTTAMTWGVFRPVIYLPHQVQTWSQSRVESVLLHELAHVRRLDFLSQAISVAACAVFWFNPLAWLGARAMRRDSESAADNAAVGAGLAPSDYASELLSLAAQLGPRRVPSAALGVAMIKRPDIESRIRSVLDPRNRRRGLTWNQAGLLFLVGSGLGFFGLVVRPSLAVRSRTSQQEVDEALYVLSLHKQSLQSRAEADPKTWGRYVPLPQATASHAKPTWTASSARSHPAAPVAPVDPPPPPDEEMMQSTHAAEHKLASAEGAEMQARQSAQYKKRADEMALRLGATAPLVDGSLRAMRLVSTEPAAKLASVTAQGDGSSPKYVDLPSFTTLDASSNVRVIFKTGRRYRIAYRWADNQNHGLAPEVKGGILSLTNPTGPELQVLLEGPELGVLRLSGGARCDCRISQRRALAADVAGDSALAISGGAERISAHLAGGSRVAITGNYPKGFTAEVDGSSALDLRGKTGAISLAVGGASHVALDPVDSGDLTMGVGGNSAVAASGRARSVSMKLEGASQAAVQDLKCDAVHVDATGNSSASLGSPRSLWAIAVGDSHVTYRGDPKIMTMKIQDSSDVRPG